MPAVEVALERSHSSKPNELTSMKNSSPSSLSHELKLLAELALPTVIIQLGFTIPPFLTASYVGLTFGPVYLDGFQLANLTCNLFTLALLQGLYSASDTLSPQAYGAGNYREVGLVAIRGFLVSIVLIVPICVLLIFFMEHGLIWFGEDAEASHYAYQWYSIYILSIPFYVLYMVTWKFLSAQNVMMPLLTASIVSCVVVLPFSLHFGTRWFGFLGSAMAVFVFQFGQASLALLYLAIRRPHKLETWPGLSGTCWREVLHWEPLKYYFYLGMGGMIASSEWIYWETLSLAIGTLGVIPLSVHTVPTQVMTVSFMIPLGLGIALAVRLGDTLPRSAYFAKQLAVVTLACGTAFFGLVSVLMYVYRQSIFRFFISEPLVLDGCEKIWTSVCLYFWQLSIYGLNMGVATGLGMQWTLGVVTIVFLWVLGLPAAWYIGVVWARSLEVVWIFIYPPYIFMNALLWFVFYWKDWEVISQNIRARECAKSIEMASSDDDEAQHSVSYGSMEEQVMLVEKVSRCTQ